MTEVILARKNPRPLMVGIDANASIDGASEYCGTVGTAKINKAGRHFRRFLHDIQLYLPATFGHLHAGSSFTYTGPGGHKSRNDYIAVQADFFHAASHHAVSTSVDLTISRDDHEAAYLEIKMTNQHTEQYNHRRTLDYDRAKIQDANKQQLYLAEL